MTDDQAEAMLAGVKVVEFAQNIAIPFAGKLLVGMGADVIKVEPPGGDAMRKLAPLDTDEGKGYTVVNGGKRSIELDLGAADAAKTVDALFAWADVALISMKLPDLPRFGLDWEHAQTVNPRLVYLIGTAFGPEGPDADIGGYDALAQARSGVGFLMNRTRDGVPTATRPAVNDVGTGMLSALGVVAALRHRDQTGIGQRVDSSLLGTAVALGTPMLNYYERDAEAVAGLRDDLSLLREAGAEFEAQREVYESRAVASGAFRLYFRPYATADGMISVAGLSSALFKKFHEVTGVPRANPAEPSSPEFIEIVDATEALFRTRTSEEWLASLRASGYPASKYNHPFEAIDDEQVRANNYIVDSAHPIFGKYSITGQPIRFERGPAPESVVERSPMLGEHTAEILNELGL